MITLLQVNLVHLQIVITFYGHTLAGGYFICHGDIMVQPDCSFVNETNKPNAPNKTKQKQKKQKNKKQMKHTKATKQTKLSHMCCRLLYNDPL